MDVLPALMVTGDGDRAVALRAALDLHIAAHDLGISFGVAAATTLAHDELAVLTSAETFLAWLGGPISIRLHAGTVCDQTTGFPTGTPTTGGNMQIHDNEQFTLSAATADAKGFPTVDPLTFSVDDDTVVTLVPGEDGQSVTIVAGAPGSAVVTVTDGTLTATEAVDVITGDTAAIVLTEGAVTTQP